MQKTEIMLVGTVHMSVDPQAFIADQEKVIEIVDQLKAYKPTKIAVEKSYYVEEELNRRYQKFINGSLTLTGDEVEQFGFRLAHHFDHPKLYAVDEIVDMSKPSLDYVFQWCKEYQPQLFEEILKIQKELGKLDDNDKLTSRILTVNSDKYNQLLQQLYMKLTKVGDRSHQIGVRWLKQWHERDLSIAANLSRITVQGDRILLLIGSDHLHLLHHFLEASQDYNIHSPTKYFS